MLSICLHLLWESESARRPLYLRTRVSTFPKEREECRQAATLYDGFQPVPDVSPANASDPSQPLERTGSASRRSRALRISHIPTETACPATTQIRCSPDSSAAYKKPSPNRNKVRPGEESGIIIPTRDCTRQAVHRPSAQSGRPPPLALESPRTFS